MRKSSTVDNQTKPRKREILKGCLGCLGLTLLLGLLFGLWLNRQAEQRQASFAQPGEHDIEARFEARRAIQTRLLSPSSAKFSHEYVVYQQKGVHVVAGEVDSQNAFGAMLRRQWTCIVQHEGGKNWRVLEPCELVGD